LKIFKENFEFVENSDLVLFHAPGYNKTIMFDEGRALHQFRADQRFRSLGIEVKRANYSEAKRAFGEIVKIYIIGEEDFC